MATPPRGRPPQQARSAATSRRLLDAACELLEEKSFDDTSVTDIAARAGVTIGALYARFGDKDGLLRVLEEELMNDFNALGDLSAVPERWTGASIEQALREQHTKLIRIYRNRRGIARALVLRSHTDPELRKRVERVNRRNLPRVAAAIAKHPGITHPVPERAMRFALLTARCVCRETILFREGWPGAKPLSDTALAEELTRMVLGYLGIRPE